MRFAALTGSFFAAVLLFSSCQKSSNLSPIPSISFKSFQATGGTTGVLSINFTDGDGDIGYPSQDPTAKPNMWVKYLYYDYTSKKFIGVYNKEDSATFDSVYFVYNVPYITPTGKDKSLTGVIQLNMTDYYANPYATLDSLQVQFQIYVYDRAGNKSNVITSRTIYPGSPTP